MEKAIIVTGTPATGKTTIAKKIAKLLSLKYLDVNKIIKEHNLSEGYDRKRRCIIIDEKKLEVILIEIIKDSDKKLVIDSHLSHYIPKKYVELCIITKCSLKELKKRLEKRGYSDDKVRENLDAEIFDICSVESAEKGHTTVILDTSDGNPDIEKVIAKLKN